MKSAEKTRGLHPTFTPNYYRNTVAKLLAECDTQAEYNIYVEPKTRDVCTFIEERGTFTYDKDFQPIDTRDNIYEHSLEFVLAEYF